MSVHKNVWTVPPGEQSTEGCVYVRKNGRKRGDRRHLAGHSGSFAFVLEAMEASEGVCTRGKRDFQNGNHKEPKGGTREAVRASPAGRKLPDDTWPWMEGVRHQGWAASDPLELRV